MTDKEARELAEEHWKWLESLLHKLYVDAMIHGIKHGKEDETRNRARLENRIKYLEQQLRQVKNDS